MLCEFDRGVSSLNEQVLATYQQCSYLARIGVAEATLAARTHG